MKEIGRGAEAVLLAGKADGRQVVVKDRVPKGYRVPQLDERIRSTRTKLESSLISKAGRFGVKVPQILDSNGSKITMERIGGERVKELLEKAGPSERKNVYELIGKAVARLHESGIVHGDLTTSNMIIRDGELYLIDFGLGRYSCKTEDQAVDLYLLYEALKSTHFKYLKNAWDTILNVYKQDFHKSIDTLHRIDKIANRRRYKGE